MAFAIPTAGLSGVRTALSKVKPLGSLTTAGATVGTPADAYGGAQVSGPSAGIGTGGTTRGLAPASDTNTLKPGSEAAFAAMNIGADQARGSIPGAAQAATSTPAVETATAAPGGDATPGVDAQSPPAPYSPTTSLTGDQSQNYTDWFQNNDDTGQQIQQLAQQQAAQGNRKAAYLASMSGGNGGFYQNGQIAAGIAGQNAMQQGLLTNAQARGNIYTNKAAALSSLGTGAQDYYNQDAIQNSGNAWQSGENRIKEGREDEKARTDSITGGLQTQRATSDNKLKSHFGDNPNSDAYNNYNEISVQIDQAIGAGDFELAQQLQDQLNNFDWGAYDSDGHLVRSEQEKARGVLNSVAPLPRGT